MGLFSKAKKAIKKVIKQSASPVAGLIGANKVSVPDAPEAAAVAPEVEVAKEDKQEDSGAETESSRKRSRTAGKKSLSVSRSSGTGLNI